jgi:HAMP domain-containing protein
MDEKLQLLVIGWFLTGVLGALIAARIQRYAWKRQHEAQQRDWKHQNEVQQRDWEHQYMVQQRDEERQLALKTFEE